MDQQVKQRIKSSICSKEKWVLDKDVSNCFRCDKKFNPIFLRKHHCRVCGHIFCAACSEYFLPGEDIGFNQKQIRMCQLCHKKILRYINQHQSKSHHHDEKKQDEDVVSKRKSMADARNQHLKDLIANEEEQNIQYSELKKMVEQKISLLVQIMLKENKIPFEYYEYLVHLIMRVIKDVPPNSMITGNMNINKHIKIIKTKGQSHADSNYFIGTAVHLNVYSKKIASKYNSARVMLVYGGMELSDIMGSESSFESLLQNRKKQLNSLIYLLVIKLGVNVIFVENNVEKQVTDVLHENSIAVFSRVSINTLTRLKNSLDIGKVVDGINKLKSYNDEDIKDITGVCKSITLCKVNSFDQQPRNYLFVQGEAATKGLTIMLAGPDESILRKIKQELRPLFVIGRHLYLKLSAIIMDQKLMHSKKLQWRKSGHPNLLFKAFNQKHINTSAYLKQNYLTYKRIVFVQSDYSIFPQIPKQEYHNLSKGSKRFLRKWEQFTEICCGGEGFKDQNRRFYSEDDWSLGQYLLKKLLNIEKRCQRCQQPGYKHIQMYYGFNLYVRVAVQARILQERTSKRVDIEDNDDNVFGQLAKRKEKHKIEHYIECQDCQQQLSSRFYVKQEHLEMSLLGFLGNIFSSTNYSLLKPYINTESSVCKHDRMCRVFQLGDTFLKVYTGFLILSPKYIMSAAKTQEFIHEKNMKYLRQVCLLHRSNIDKIVFYLQEELKVFSDLTKMVDFESIIQNPKASMLKAKTSFVRNSMLTQSQCMQVMIPQILQQVQRVQVASEGMINYKKVKNHCQAQFYYKLCANILQRITNVLVSMKKSAEKRQLNQKYSIPDQENDLVENMDLSAFEELKEQQTASTQRRTRVQSQFTQITDRITIDDGGDDDNNKNYENWISTQEAQPTGRKYRKSQTTFPFRKQIKLSQQQIENIFKFSHWPYKYEHHVVEFLTPNPHVAQSLIAAALNTSQHYQFASAKQDLLLIDSLKIKLTEGDNSDLAQKYEDIKKSYTLVDVQQKMMEINNQKKIPHVQVNILYPQMFERIREWSDINLKEYIYTIAGVQSWVTTGGKSGSPFMRAHNDLVIVKKITEKEFYCLKKILPEYLKHLEQGSLLTPIFGSYEVTRGPKTQYFIVMQNLFFGMSNWQIYDFKGSKTKRFSKPPVIPLDINYIIDRNSEPLITATNILADLPKTLNFLAKNNIIDYSLILAVEDQNSGSLDGCPIKIGIVDYLREYGGLEKIQTVIKGLKGTQTTVIGAVPYKERMLASVTKYFCSLPH